MLCRHGSRCWLHREPNPCRGAPSVWGHRQRLISEQGRDCPTVRRMWVECVLKSTTWLRKHYNVPTNLQPEVPSNQNTQTPPGKQDMNFSLVHLFAIKY